MPRFHLPRVRALVALAALAALAACQLSLDHAVCPCAEGWTCCAASQVCVAEPAQCPGQEPQVQRLSFEHPLHDEHFGGAVALDGDRAAVGVPGDDRAGVNSGAAIVFERRGGAWLRVAVLTAPDPTQTAELGTSVAFVGPDALIAGAPGAGDDRAGRVYVFRKGNDGWSWQQTIAPDLTSVPQALRSQLQFGRELGADGDRFIVGADEASAEVYELASAGAARVARFVAFPSPEASIGLPTGVALHGHTAELHEQYANGVYVFEEALGWAGTRIADLNTSDFIPRQAALDGQRVAIPGPSGMVRIVERTPSGWSAPSDVALALPAAPGTWLATRLAWHGDDLVLAANLVGFDVLGLGRIRLVAGSWTPDPMTSAPHPYPAWSALAISDDRVLVGLPYSGTEASGTAVAFSLDDTGYVADSIVTIDDRPAFVSIVGDHRQIVTLAPVIDAGSVRAGWFTADQNGQYHDPPALLFDRRSRIGWIAAVSGSHALLGLAGMQSGVLPFELGERDWVVGTPLVAPDASIQFTQGVGGVAVDGDTAVIAATASVPAFHAIALVYTWTSAGWQLSTTLGGPGCSPQVAISGARIAMACGAELRLFQNTGGTWVPMSAPPLTQNIEFLTRILLSDDRLVAETEPMLVNEVFRWVDGEWRSELRLDGTHPILALSGDRMVAYHDRTSVTPYRFTGGALVVQPLLTLPAEPRNPDAAIQSVVLTDTQVVVGVPNDGGSPDQPQGAIYVLPWR